MGKGSAEIEHDIQHRRRALTERINRLDARVRQDVEDARSEVEARKQQLAETAKDSVARSKEKVAGINDKLPGEDSKVASHPNLLLVGSLAAGLAAGIATGGDDDDRPQRRHGARHEDEGHGVFGKGVDAAKGYLGSELSTALKELADQAFGRGNGDAMEHGLPGLVKSAWERVNDRSGDDTHAESRDGQRRERTNETHEYGEDTLSGDFEQRARAEMRN